MNKYVANYFKAERNAQREINTFEPEINRYKLYRNLMSELLKKTELLEAKIKKMITLQQGFMTEISGLKTENQHLTEQIHKQQEEIRMLGEELRLFRHAGTVQAEQPADTGEVKIRLDEMIRDIDQCLALLNR
ncbi:MAG: hypothetical protein ACK5B6_13285 [Bacteroidia bacterium]